MEFLAAVGAFALIVLVGYLVLRNLDNKSSQAEANRQLVVKSGELFEFERFCKSHPELSHKQALLKYYEDEDVRNEAIKKAQKHIQLEKEWEDKANRERSIKRVFAYKYENFIFSLFSPLAKKSEFNNEEWECKGSLPLCYVTHKMQEEYGTEESNSLFQQFIDNKLIRRGSYSNFDNIYLGDILEMYYNVISDDDLNMSNYIKKYGRRCSYDELQAEIHKLNESMN